MAVFVLSRKFGAGGRTIGESLARQLGYTFIDKDIIDWMAHEADLSLEWIETVEKESGGRLAQTLSTMVIHDFIERRLNPEPEEFDLDKYVIFARKIITDAAAEGDAVIVGRGASLIAPQAPDTFRILLVSPFEERIAFLKKQYNLDRAQAELLVESETRKSGDYLKKISPEDPYDPEKYHLCLNTGLIGITKAEKMILDLL